MNDTCQSTLMLAYAEYVPRDCALCRAYPYMPLKPQGSRVPRAAACLAHIRVRERRRTNEKANFLRWKPLLYKAVKP